MLTYISAFLSGSRLNLIRFKNGYTANKAENAIIKGKERFKKKIFKKKYLKKIFKKKYLKKNLFKKNLFLKKFKKKYIELGAF